MIIKGQEWQADAHAEWQHFREREDGPYWGCAIFFHLLQLHSTHSTPFHFLFFSSPKSQGKIHSVFYSRRMARSLSQPPLQLEQVCDLGSTNQMRLLGI